MSKVVILGGGISGLSAAYYLSKASNVNLSKIIILESSKRFGGWLQTTRCENGSLFEHGTRSIRPQEKQGRNTIRLVEDLGLSDEVIGISSSEAASSKRYLYVNKQIHIVPNNPAMLFKATPFTSSPLLFKVLGDFIFRKRVKEDESIHSLFEKRLGKEVADIIVSSVFRGIFAGDTKLLSLQSCIPVLYRAVKNHGSIFAGSLKEAKATVKEIQVEEYTPLMKRVVKGKWSTWSLKNGVQHIIERLVEVLQEDPRVELRTESPCTRLQYNNEGAQVFTDTDTIQADHVISAILSKDLAAILPSEHSSLSSSLNRIPAVTCVVVNLEYPGKQNIPEGFGVLLPEKEDGPVLGVVFDSYTFPAHDRKDQDSTRLTLMLGGHWYDELRDRVGSLDEDSLSSFSCSTIERLLNITDKPSRVIVSIQKDCIPQYYVGHAKLVENMFDYIKEKQLPLTLIGNSYKGVAVNDCILNAKLGATRVVESLQQ